jgi:hypothetical protein
MEDEEEKSTKSTNRMDIIYETVQVLETLYNEGFLKCFFLKKDKKCIVCLIFIRSIQTTQPLLVCCTSSCLIRHSSENCTGA